MDNKSKQTELEVSFTNYDWKQGYSISLGFGSKYVKGDDGIYIDSIEKGSLIESDGQIWVGDRITAVKNGVNGDRIHLNNTSYETSRILLKRACRYRKLVLIIRKCEIDLTSNDHDRMLGLSVAGGIDNEFIPADCRIYVSSIKDGSIAALNGRLSIGDRLLGIRHNFFSNQFHSDNFFLFDMCTNKEAVAMIKNAQNCGSVSLMISKGDDPLSNLKVRFGNTHIRRIGGNNKCSPLRSDEIHYNGSRCWKMFY